MNSIVINLSKDAYSNANRKLEHKSLIINSNLEMSQEAQVVFYNDQGEKMIDVISADENLSESQKNINRDRFKNQTYGSNTAGSYVDPVTGAEILPGENGFDPEIQKVSELEFWQQLPAAFFSGANLSSIAPSYTWKAGNTLAELVYNGIQFSMVKMAERNRV